MADAYGIKYISKKAGLTGIEAKNISKSLRGKGIDYQTIDWETIGGDLYGHGKRTGGVKHHLKNMYGINLALPETEKHINQGVNQSVGELINLFEGRSKRSRQMDLRRDAKGTFSPSDITGVKLWKKNPNLYDIIGVDDPILIF